MGALQVRDEQQGVSAARVTPVTKHAAAGDNSGANDRMLGADRAGPSRAASEHQRTAVAGHSDCWYHGQTSDCLQLTFLCVSVWVVPGPVYAAKCRVVDTNLLRGTPGHQTRVPVELRDSCGNVISKPVGSKLVVTHHPSSEVARAAYGA